MIVKAFNNEIKFHFFHRENDTKQISYNRDEMNNLQKYAANDGENKIYEKRVKRSILK